MKIALAQINSTVGDIKGNADKIISRIRAAKNAGSDMVIFPELALVGYPPEDLLLKPHFIEENKNYLARIKEECRGIIALVGFVDSKGTKIYNACALLCDAKIVAAYHKIHLPNYGVFDEKRYFSAGDKILCYSLGRTRFAVSICEDIWIDDFVRTFRGKKLDFIVNISASPFYLRKICVRQNTLSRAAKISNSFVLYCNLVGGQDELIFDGTSEVFSPEGKLILQNRRFSEGLTVFTLKKNAKYKHISMHSSDEEEIYSALSLGLRDYVRKNEFKKVILGVSGGIDSAVVVALATIALGKENVSALIMPSHYTSAGTFADAKQICKNLGISYHIIDIDKIVKTYADSLKPFFYGYKPDKTEENLQARIRGNLLMAFSNKFGYLVLNTGNKSEVSCGYCTLYGDMVGGFGILKDVSKAHVYKLAYYINRVMGKKVIPISTIKRAPSAELKPHQKDSDSLPSYPLLDPILKLYIEEGFSLEQIVRKGFSRQTVRRVINMVDASEYKRRQATIGIKITPRAFGKDRRMPITNKFAE